MPIKVTCPGCQKTYSVPDTTAGKKVKCPACQQTIDVPPAATGASAGASSAGGSSAGGSSGLRDMWRVRTGDGQGYGPIGKKELDEWVAEGRLDANCQVLQDGTKEWRWATELYPQLAQQEQPTTPSAQAAAAQAAVTPGMAGAAGIGVAQATNPYAYTGSSAAANVYGVACLPHRGALSLTLAIVAAACVVITFFGCVFSMVCPPLPLITAVAGIGFGIPPWLISMSDLSGMRVGRRETSGRGMVLTAYIMGLAAAIVSFILLIPAILALFGVVLCCMPFPFAGAQAQ